MLFCYEFRVILYNISFQYGFFPIITRWCPIGCKNEYNTSSFSFASQPLLHIYMDNNIYIEGITIESFAGIEWKIMWIPLKPFANVYTHWYGGVAGMSAWVYVREQWQCCEWAMTRKNGISCYSPIYSSASQIHRHSHTNIQYKYIICHLLLFIQCVLPPLLYYYLKSFYPLCFSATRVASVCGQCTHSIASFHTDKHAAIFVKIYRLCEFVCERAQAITMQPICNMLLCFIYMHIQTPLPLPIQLFNV